MHFARLIVVVVFVLAIAFSYVPQVHQQLGMVWQAIRPDVIQTMDGLYATLRNFVAGTKTPGGIDNDAPVNFDEIITRGPGVLF